MAHHAAAMERARADSQRVQYELARASAASELSREQTLMLGYTHAAPHPASGVWPPHRVSAQHLVAGVPSPYASSYAVSRYFASAPPHLAAPASYPTAHAPSRHGPYGGTSERDGANDEPPTPSAVAVGSASSVALAEAAALSRMRADLAARSAATAAAHPAHPGRSVAATRLSRTLAEHGYPNVTGGGEYTPYASPYYTAPHLALPPGTYIPLGAHAARYAKYLAGKGEGPTLNRLGQVAGSVLHAWASESIEEVALPRESLRSSRAPSVVGSDL